jgi:hypothetical protein
LRQPQGERLLPHEGFARIEALRTKLHQDLERAIGSVEGLAGDMRMTVVHKDATYESLSDEKFLEAARKVFPDLPQLHAAFVVVAPARDAGVL